MIKKIFLALALGTLIAGTSNVNISQATPIKLAMPTVENASAKVLQVNATGEANNYTFAVTISSPDTGCDQYADWWEVITPEGELIYRRVLLHSHVDEQPFERTGGVVAIQPQQEVIIRVHMSNSGYSPQVQQGNVSSGFTASNLSPDFANDLASIEPLPKDCAF